MTDNRSLPPFALAMMALPVGLGALLCWVRPEGAGLWTVAMIALPAAWLAIRAASRTPAKIEAAADLMRPGAPVDFGRAMAVASLVVAVPLAARLAEALGLAPTPLAHALATRWVNVLVGAYLVAMGNRLPKILTPLAEAGADPAAMEATRRRTGWVIVLAGLVYIVLWLALPERWAQLAGPAVLVIGIVGPSVAMRARGRRTRLPWRR